MGEGGSTIPADGRYFRRRQLSQAWRDEGGPRTPGDLASVTAPLMAAGTLPARKLDTGAGEAGGLRSKRESLQGNAACLCPRRMEAHRIGLRSWIQTLPRHSPHACSLLYPEEIAILPEYHCVKPESGHQNSAGRGRRVVAAFKRQSFLCSRASSAQETAGRMTEVHMGPLQWPY